MFKTRAEVIRWLMDNPGKALVSDGCCVKWDTCNGPVFAGGAADGLSAGVDCAASSYRIPFQPQRFGPWETVATREEATEVGCAGERMIIDWYYDEPHRWIIRPSAIDMLNTGTHWVRFVGDAK